MSIAVPLTMLPARAARNVVATTPITVYGTWCNVNSHRICRYLRKSQVQFTFVDLDVRPDAEAYIRQFCADAAVPVVYVDGDWLTCPSLEELDEALESRGWLVGAKNRSTAGSSRWRRRSATSS